MSWATRKSVDECSARELIAAANGIDETEIASHPDYETARLAYLEMKLIYDLDTATTYPGRTFTTAAVTRYFPEYEGRPHAEIREKYLSLHPYLRARIVRHEG